jgi:hypothetical protein
MQSTVHCSLGRVQFIQNKIIMSIVLVISRHCRMRTVQREWLISMNLGGNDRVLIEVHFGMFVQVG